MAKDTSAVIFVPARCTGNRQEFALRFQRVAQGWIATDALSLGRQTVDRGERLDRRRIEGEIAFGPDYPGCRGCGAQSAFRCSCGGVGCWDGKSAGATCPWCGSDNSIDAQTVQALDGHLDL
jgi:hypothetical protein